MLSPSALAAELRQRKTVILHVEEKTASDAAFAALVVWPIIGGVASVLFLSLGLLIFSPFLREMPWLRSGFSWQAGLFVWAVCAMYAAPREWRGIRRKAMSLSLARRTLLAIHTRFGKTIGLAELKLSDCHLARRIITTDCDDTRTQYLEVHLRHLSIGTMTPAGEITLFSEEIVRPLAHYLEKTEELVTTLVEVTGLRLIDEACAAARGG